MATYGYCENKCKQEVYNKEETNALLNNKQDKMIEGTWTPKISTLAGIDPTVNYDVQQGYYRRIGDMVWVSFYCRGKITALNATNNYAFIKGLPFNNKDLQLGHQPLQLGMLYGLVSLDTNACLDMYSNGIRVQNGYGAGAAELIVTQTPYFELGGSGWYLIKE